MFERNSVDQSAGSRRKAIAVSLTLDDGTALSGVCHVASTRSLADELNQPGGFLDFETYQGERSFISKSAIARVVQIDLPKADQLTRSSYFSETADPYTVLGVQRGMSPADFQAAYHKLAKQYHPDRFAGLDLPKEMAAYASDMSRRVNEAYSLLQVAEQDAAARRVREAELAAAPKTAFEEFQRQAASRYATT